MEIHVAKGVYPRDDPNWLPHRFHCALIVIFLQVSLGIEAVKDCVDDEWRHVHVEVADFSDVERQVVHLVQVSNTLSQIDIPLSLDKGFREEVPEAKEQASGDDHTGGHSQLNNLP